MYGSFSQGIGRKEIKMSMETKIGKDCVHRRIDYVDDEPMAEYCELGEGTCPCYRWLSFLKDEKTCGKLNNEKEVKMKKFDVTMYFDGNVNDNGSPDSKGSCTYVLECNGKTKVKTINLVLGITNNQAEFNGLIFGIQALNRKKEVNLNIIGDSKLVVNQVSRKWECKNQELKKLRGVVDDLLNEVGSWKIKWVSRDKNKAGK